MIAIYDVPTDAWSVSSATLPVAECGIPAAFDGTSLIYFVNDATGAFYSFNVDDNTITALTSCPGGYFRYGQATCHAGKFYVMGGFGYQHFYEYDPTATTWTQLADYGVNINNAAMTSYDGKIWLWGGSNGWVTGYTDVKSYDPDNPGEGWVIEGSMLHDHGNSALGFGAPDYFYASGALYPSVNASFFETTVKVDPTDAGVVEIIVPASRAQIGEPITPKRSSRTITPPRRRRSTPTSTSTTRR